MEKDSKSMVLSEKSMMPISLVVIVVMGIAYCYTTFATIAYVDKRHDEIKTNLDEVRQDSKDTKSMVMDLYRSRFSREPALKASTR